MNFLPQIQDGFYRWIDSVAGTVDAMLDRLRSKRDVQVVEVEHDPLGRVILQVRSHPGAVDAGARIPTEYPKQCPKGKPPLAFYAQLKPRAD